MAVSTVSTGVRTFNRHGVGGRHQHIETGHGHASVTNRTRFGRALQRACRTDRIHAVMPDHGFFDGGCLSLALALTRLIGRDARIRYVGRPGRLDHAVCAVRLTEGVVYLDADGLADLRDIRAKLLRIELRGVHDGPLSVVSASRREARRVGIDDWGGVSERLADVLAPTLQRHRDRSRWLAATTPCGKSPSTLC